MQHLRSRAAVLLTAAALALGAALTAPPASAAAGSAYGYHYDEAEAYVPSSGSSVFVFLHSTGTAYQVWINGGVGTSAYKGAHVTWRGFSGNGTWRLTVGANYTDAIGRPFYVRMALYAGNYGDTCQAWGDAPSNFVTYCYA